MNKVKTKTLCAYIYVEHLADRETLFRKFMNGYQWSRARLLWMIRHAKLYGYIEQDGNLLYLTRKGLIYLGIIKQAPTSTKPAPIINKPKSTPQNQWLYQASSAAGATPAGSVFNTRNRHAFNLTPQCAPRTAGTGRLAHDTCHTNTTNAA